MMDLPALLIGPLASVSTTPVEALPSNSCLATVPWIPALGALACGILGLMPRVRNQIGYFATAVITLTFALTVIGLSQSGYFSGSMQVVENNFWTWIEVGRMRLDMVHRITPLVGTMLLIVTGIASLISMYATGYMRDDSSTGRFFAAICLFVAAMCILVMGRTLLTVFLGWEGVGLCSYLLIGYYFDRPEAVEASKKAFIVNRIGDMGFLIAIFLCWRYLDTLNLDELAPLIQEQFAAAPAGTSLAFGITAIPFCLMIAAFGKSAQIPLFVWLPDAMAGPTPVSALIHAATMVTAGVFLVARCFPLFEAIPLSLDVIAVVGSITALMAATIAMASYDLKAVFAYSTVSQLGYMFVGLGAHQEKAAVFHLATHALFKALLFLTAGSVMHALTGQLDIRTMSGLRRRMPITATLMLIGCLALAGFPLTAGFFSKDAILAGTLDLAIQGNRIHQFVAVIAFATAFLTAFYAFRLWCRVFLGEEKFVMGNDHHGHGKQPTTPHEMPWWPMNAPLVLLALGALGVGMLIHFGEHSSLLGVLHHTVSAGHAHGLSWSDWTSNPTGDAHKLAMVMSIALALLGIASAWLMYSVKRDWVDKASHVAPSIRQLLQKKWLIDEFYDRTIVRPLWIVGCILFSIDSLIIGGTISLLGWFPVAGGRISRMAQHGQLQGYGLAMLIGIALASVFLVYALSNAGLG